MAQTNNLVPEARTLINQLRSRIRSYVFWEGLALVIVVLGALFWLSFALDWAYFRFSHLELPRWFRALVLISGIGLVTMGAFSWIGLRLLRGLRTKALALVLERRFPELDDRLVTAVEAAEGLSNTDSPVTAAMLQKTLTDVAEVTRRLDVRSVFDQRPLRRALMIAAGLIASILGLMVVDSAAMERWVAGYLSLQDGYWPRETELVIKVVVQPGDQLREFTDRHYRHPKGGDLALQIEVPPGKTLPNRIRLDSRMGRGMSQTWLTPTADGVFRHSFVGLIEDSRLWISGGDFSHSQPYWIEVVPPPEVTRVVLSSLYPPYTGLNRQTEQGVERTPSELKGAQISLPLETDFLLEIAANKPLQRARIEGDAGADRWEITISSDQSGTHSATILLKSQDGKPQLQHEIPLPPGSESFWSQGGTAFSLPFLLSAAGATRLPEQLRGAAETHQSLTLPITLPTDSLLRITLEDRDQIVSPAPTRFTINGIVDQPPVVETRLKGIGSSITRKARIPVAGTVIDDYGVASVKFEFKVDDGAEWQQRNLANPPEEGTRTFSLQRNEQEIYERFDVQPLDLSIKQRLTLTVAALDGCTVPSMGLPHFQANAGQTPDAPQPSFAHRATGLKFVLTIIPEEELLSMLYGRELNLRKRIEQIIAESKITLKELQTQHDLLKETPAARESADTDAATPPATTPPANSVPATTVPATTVPAATVQTSSTPTANRLSLSAVADRSLHGIRKNATETAGVESAFAEIREELVNNAADTPAMLERLDQKILAPLNNINTATFPQVDGALGLFRLALDKELNPRGDLENSIESTTTLIRQLESVLGEMAEMARFDAILEDLKKTIKSEMDLLEETKRKRKEKAIKALE